MGYELYMGHILFLFTYFLTTSVSGQVPGYPSYYPTGTRVINYPDTAALTRAGRRPPRERNRATRSARPGDRVASDRAGAVPKGDTHLQTQPPQITSLSRVFTNLHTLCLLS